MKSILIWFKAVRAPFFTASLVPALVGAALAKHEGVFDFTYLWLGLAVLISNQAGANLLNDYYDALGSDRVNQTPTPFSGGSRLIQQGILSRKAFLKATVISYSLGLLILLLATWMRQNLLVLGLGVSGMVLGIAYSVKISNAMGRGWGEIAVGMAFGPLAVLGSYLLQTNQLSQAAVLAGIPVGFLVMGVLILNQIPDFKADLAVGKRNWVVRLGGGMKGVGLYLAVIFLAYLSISIGVFTNLLPARVLISYATIPLAIWVLIKARYTSLRVAEIVPALAGNIGLQIATGLLLAIGICWN
jgi:1,4-dihydroxy-2-naphthoate octaprenyltransferase